MCSFGYLQELRREAQAFVDARPRLDKPRQGRGRSRGMEAVLSVCFEKLQQRAACGWRCGALQIFKRGTFELPVIRMQGPKRDANRILGQQERQQCEKVLQVAVGTALQLIVEEPFGLARIAAI